MLSIRDKFNEIQKNMPEKSCIEKMIKGCNYICCLMMMITSLVRYVEYDAETINMDMFYIVFTFYLSVFGVLLGAAEF